MIWEANGPGWDFGRQVVKLYRYPNYYVDQQSGTVQAKKTKRYGWHATREKKEEALGVLRRAYAHSGYINHSSEALDEALTYVYYDGGGIGPANLVEEGAEARKCHGDRVIADMLTLWGVEGKTMRPSNEKMKPPENSMAYRRQQRERARKQTRNLRRDQFDFRQEGGSLCQ